MGGKTMSKRHIEQVCVLDTHKSSPIAYIHKISINNKKARNRNLGYTIRYKLTNISP